MAGPIKLFEGVAHASLYQKFRPTVPQSVFKRILSHLQEKKSQPFKLAVDVGCGSGQITRPLASHFERVIGIDVSESQLETARQISSSANVEYRIGVAEKIPAVDGAVDLVACCQAVHWFDYAAFLKEVDRVLRPQGCLAIIGYGNRVPQTNSREQDRSKDEKLERLFTNFYERSALAPYWSDRRKHIDNLYSDFTIPYVGSVRDDTIEMTEEVTVASFIGYIRTWSAYRTFLEQNPEAPDPLIEFYERFMEVLGVDKKEDQTIIQLKAPIVLLLGRKPPS